MLPTYEEALDRGGFYRSHLYKGFFIGVLTNENKHLYNACMDQVTRDEFNRITDIPADSLTPAEIDFLFARRSYLNKSQRNEFGALMKIKDQQVKEATE